jgi:hypothetical protein
MLNDNFDFDQNMETVLLFDFSKNTVVKAKNNNNVNNDIDIVRDLDFINNIKSTLINDFGDLVIIFNIK